MQIILYQNDSEPEKVDKDLTAALTLAGSLRNTSEVINPSILIAVNAGIVSGYNYAYIPLFDRYYYITDMTSNREGLTTITMRVDVLMSWRTQIRANRAVINHQERAGNVYLNDGTWFHDSRNFYNIKTFANGFNDTGEFILITAGA